MNNQTRRALAWPYGVVGVDAWGGMLGPTVFVLPDGRQISPFQIAPWFSEPGSAELPGILRQLRGEWPCVPFGADADREAIGDWPRSKAEPTVDPFGHGYGSNNRWEIDTAEGEALRLSIGYPDEHPIARLERMVVPDPSAPALDLELTVYPRRTCDLPIGLHPTFRLPSAPGTASIEVEGSVRAATFPGELDRSSLFAPDQILPRWSDVPLRDGSSLDVSRVPLPRETEDLLQLIDPPGRIALWNRHEGYRVRLSWNREHFPSALLWFSNRGRQFAPWNGRHLALGIEPICSAFDLGPQISTASNPISRLGVPTTHRFIAGEPFTTRYRIEVEAA